MNFIPCLFVNTVLIISRKKKMDKRKDNVDEELLRLKDSLHSLAYKLISNSEGEKDLLQDLTLKALNNRDKSVSQENFKGWFFTIMKNIVQNNLKKEPCVSPRAKKSDELNILNIPQELDFESPDESCTLKEINKVISSLSNEYRYPLLMFIIGCEYIDIASSMNLPIGTVKSRIFHARKKLRVLSKDL